MIKSTFPRRLLSLACLGWCLAYNLPAAANQHEQTVIEKDDDGPTLEENQVDFLRAVKVDNADAVKRLAAAGVAINAIEPERGDSPLMTAIREDANGVVKALLEMPAIDLEIKAKNGDTAIMLAAYKGNLKVVRALLERGAKVNRPGWTALHYAAFIGNNEIIQLLLEHEANINAEAPNKNTPIMMAAYGGHIFAVKLLLDQGADLHRKNDRGMSALDLAKMANHQDIVEGLNFQLEKQKK